MLGDNERDEILGLLPGLLPGHLRRAAPSLSDRLVSSWH